MLNKAKWLKADEETMYKEARRYGNIVADAAFDLDDGSHRLITIQHYGTKNMYHLKNGTVVLIQHGKA